jgi:hypothetical protein
MERKTKDKTEGKKIEKASVVNKPVCQFLGFHPCHWVRWLTSFERCTLDWRPSRCNCIHRGYYCTHEASNNRDGV